MRRTSPPGPTPPVDDVSGAEDHGVVAHALEKYRLRDRVQPVILAYDSGRAVPRGAP